MVVSANSPRPPTLGAHEMNTIQNILSMIRIVTGMVFVAMAGLLARDRRREQSLAQSGAER